MSEIALSLVLLSSAGLLMRSFLKLQTTELGFNPENTLFVSVPVGSGNQKTTAAQQQFLGQILSRIRTMPGVVSAGATSRFPPFGGFTVDFDISGIGHWTGGVPTSNVQRRLLPDPRHAAPPGPRLQ